MRIAGYQKLTLIDYPGKIATTIFTVGCSFKCPFCHNPELVLASKFPPLNDMEKEFLNFLKKRKGKLEGVCITGGEPTIQPDLVEFIKKIRKLGYFVKLDSNGTRPDVLKKLIDEKLVDFIAMDIKNSRRKYKKTVGDKNFDLGRVEKSVELIMNSKIDYEFRTTVVPGFHREKDFEDIASWIKGADAYYLQKYRDNIVLNKSAMARAKGRAPDLEGIRDKISSNFKKIGIRQ